MNAQIPGLVLMLPLALKPSVNLRDQVGLVLGEHTINGVQRGQMVSIVPRAEVSLYISRDDARFIPAGRADALPIFVKDRGARHAFLLPITDDLRRSLSRLGPGGALS
jgi:hypothetical protein